MEMSGNSCCSDLQTAPIVIDFPGGAPEVSTGGRSISAISDGPLLPLEERELVLADLQLVAVLEPVRLDAAAVDVGPVQRAAIGEVQVAPAAHDERVVAGDRHIVEEDVGVGAPADRHAVAIERKALPHAP